jgi:uncharacterized protein
MPEYLSPGVYVEEVPSTIKPIVGVSTTTAAFVGIVPNGGVDIPEDNPDYDPGDPNARRYRLWHFPFPQAEVDNARGARDQLARPGSRPPQPADGVSLRDFRIAQERFALASARLGAGELAPAGQPILCTSFADFTRNFGGFSTHGLPPPPEGTPAPPPVAGGPGAPPAPGRAPAPAPAAPAGGAPLVGQNQLAHGVFGFFNNGGTRCYVMRYDNLGDLQDPMALAPLEPIDEISMVVAPGITDNQVQMNIVEHCENLTERFAILDGQQLRPADPNARPEFTVDNILGGVGNSDYGAIYFPWIKVSDTPSRLMELADEGEIWVGPSGHVSGVFARVDEQRGVHKAPANEVVRGARDVEFQISKSAQAGLNPHGINAIRFINNNITVWGARTIGGDMNTDLKYINVRRLLIFIRKSIDQGTQWVVFEPNDASLWAKIVRNVTAFLTTVWRDGALFGTTPEEAFYVKCDLETNPPEERDLGRVITEIGVAIVRPAEFVIFRVEQWAGPQP